MMRKMTIAGPDRFGFYLVIKTKNYIHHKPKDLLTKDQVKDLADSEFVDVTFVPTLAASEATMAYVHEKDGTVYGTKFDPDGGPMPGDGQYQDGRERVDVRWNGNEWFMKASGTVDKIGA